MPPDASLLSTQEYEKQQFIRCNTFGHAWFDYDNSDWTPEWGEPLVLRCERCGSERRDTISTSTGDIIGRHYFHPDGYSYDRGTRPTRSEFRILLLAKKIEERGKPKRRKAADTP